MKTNTPKGCHLCQAKINQFSNKKDEVPMKYRKQLKINDNVETNVYLGREKMKDFGCKKKTGTYDFDKYFKLLGSISIRLLNEEPRSNDRS